MTGAALFLNWVFLPAGEGRLFAVLLGAVALMTVVMIRQRHVMRESARLLELSQQRADSWSTGTGSNVDSLDYAGRIARNAAVLSKLTTELLEFSGLDRNKVSLHVEPLPLSEFVLTVVERLEVVRARHHLALSPAVVAS